MVDTSEKNGTENEETTFVELLHMLWNRKWLFSSIVLFSGAVGVLIALMLPDVYRSEALVAPIERSESVPLGALSRTLGGLASAIPLSLGKVGASRSDLILATLQSRGFLYEYIERRDLLVPLFAGVGWNRETEELDIDPKIFDQGSGEWVRKVKPPRTQRPSSWEAYEKLSKQLRIEEDKSTGFLQIEVFSLSPVMAREWLSWLIEDVDNHIRKREVEEARLSLDFLQERLNKTSRNEIRQSIYPLIEKQLQTLMMAEVNSNYSLRVIDEPFLPGEKHSPSRKLIVIMFLAIGSLLGAFFVLIYPKR
jgi:uncharacterized protein involved in exopolysaccharide biosynthesis